MSSPQSLLYFFGGWALFLSKTLKVAGHRHHLIQVQVALERPCCIDFGDGYSPFSAVIIDTNRFHELDGRGSWQATILIDPEHESVVHLGRSNLTSDGAAEPEPNLVEPFVPELRACAEQAYTFERARDLTDKLLASLFDHSRHRIESGVNNDHVRQVLRLIRDLPEKKVSVKTLAERVHLSEFHLMHLFKEEVGIPIRRYLLWARLLDALEFVLDGVSLTAAAHQSGFADLAHLSRTFRQTFGATLSDLIRGSKNNAVRIFTDPD